MTKFKKTIVHLTKAEITDKIREIAKQVSKLRLEQSVKKHKNLRGVFNLRHQLAILKTKLNSL